ncbi:MAG: Fe-S protein assembly co-chaperone HscB [Methylophilaceae bacterium]
MNHFQLFNLPQTFAIDSAALDTQYRRLQSEVHPDRFTAGSDAEKLQSLQSATQANDAYQTLKNPLQRARYLLKLKGLDTQEESNTAMPKAFLMQQMEWREAIEEAGDVAQLEALQHEILDAEKTLQTKLRLALDQNDDAVATENVRQLSFMDKLLSEIDSAIEQRES